MAAAAATAALLLTTLVAAASAHTYHFGSCPRVTPMAGFSMSKFMGKWHVLEKTSTRVRCLTNEYMRPGEQEGDWERGPAKVQAKGKATSEWEEVDAAGGADKAREWRLLQRMQLPLPAVNNGVRYNAKITLADDTQPAAMTVKFPLNIMGSSSYVVFDTDYDTYAGVYSCQSLAFWHRHSASIMSRSASLDARIISKLRNRLTSYGIEVRDLDKIRQTCPDGAEDGIQVHIKPNVFRTNATDILQDANDVVASAADAAKRAIDVYNTVNTVYTAVQGGRRRRDSVHGDLNLEPTAPFEVEESTSETFENNEMNQESSTDIDGGDQELVTELKLEESISKILETIRESSTENATQEYVPTEGSYVNSGIEIDVVVEENNNTSEMQDDLKVQDKIMEISDSGLEMLNNAGANVIPVPEDEVENERNLERDTEVNERTLSNFLADLTVDWMP